MSNATPTTNGMSKTTLPLRQVWVAPHPQHTLRTAYCFYIERETERDRERQRQRDRDRQTDGGRQMEGDRDRDRERPTDRQTDTDRQRFGRKRSVRFSGTQEDKVSGKTHLPMVTKNIGGKLRLEQGSVRMAGHPRESLVHHLHVIHTRVKTVRPRYVILIGQAP